jgi:hypothetical protein
MGSLIPEADLRRAQEKYYAANPTREMVCIRTLKANPTMTTAELSLILGRSQSWVRRVLKAAGLSAARVKGRKQA